MPAPPEGVRCDDAGCGDGLRLPAAAGHASRTQFTTLPERRAASAKVLTLAGRVAAADLGEGPDDGQPRHVGSAVLAPALVLVPVSPQEDVTDLEKHIAV